MLMVGLPSCYLHAQTIKDSLPHDSVIGQNTSMLGEVVVTAYNQDRKYFLTATPVAIPNPTLANRGGQELLLQTINALPGVQLDERSPDSYRLNMRGSSTRSPFGVRNVKVYYNGIPFTEPGGTTYLNHMSYQKFAGAEFLKGPGGSNYGAGTGGVVLLQDGPLERNALNVTAGYGSYNTFSMGADGNFVSGKTATRASVYWDGSKGYRDHAGSHKALYTLSSRINFNSRNVLQFSFLRGDLNYFTPGGLTLKEYLANRRASRPAVGSFPSADQAQAAISQQTTLAGLDFKSDLGNGFTQETNVYWASTRLVNPAIRNYSDTRIPHLGLRSVWGWAKDVNTDINTAIHAGVETQWGKNNADVYANNLGQKDKQTQQTRINTHPLFYFLQNDWNYKGWQLQLAGAFHYMYIDINSILPAASKVNFKYTGIFTPRVSLSKSIDDNWFVYANFGKGFSPATTDEIYPSGSDLNLNLKPESGYNYELGIRRKVGKYGMIELNGYYFKLENTIVQRRDAGGGDYYLNAGSTRQPGIEANWNQLFLFSNEWRLNANIAYAYQPYQYHSFVTSSGDFSKNKIPGVSKNKISSGFILNKGQSWQLYVQYQYLDKMFLDDGNMAPANAYNLLSAGINKCFAVAHHSINIGFNANNLLNEKYSLGNDINAAAGRYYNAAPLSNYTVRLSYSLN